MYQSHSFTDRLNRFIRDKSLLTRIILLNIAVWAVINFTRVIAFLYQSSNYPAEDIWMSAIQSWLAVPANINVLFSRPWTLLSYMFLHISLWHIFFNMLWLYWFGKIFLEFMNGRKLLTIYILGGIAGGLAFIAAYNIFPAFGDVMNRSIALGASASVLAIVVATAVMVPEYTISLIFIGNIKIKYIALVTIVIDVFMIRSDNPGGHFTHLGGALAGLIYILFNKSSLLASFSSFPGIFSWRPKRKAKFKKVHRSSRPLTDEEYNEIKADNQKKIDTILDKIAKSGYKSLSNEEKEFLFKYSNK